MEIHRLQIELASSTSGRVEVIHARGVPANGSLHVHSKTSVALVLGRAQLFCTAESRRRAEVGSILVAPSGLAHGNAPAEGHTIDFLSVEFDTALERPGDFTGEVRGEEIRRTMSRLVQVESLSSKIRTECVEGLLPMIRGRIAAVRARLMPPGPWESCRDRLQSNLHGGVTLAQLARLTGRHVDSVSRGFKREHGIPPHRYLISARLDRARFLLGQGACLTDAALESGFTDQSHLSRHFKRQYGMTPGRFRRSVRNVQDRRA